MKVILSTTADPKYLFYVPITAWCWKQIGVDPVLLYEFSTQQNILKILRNSFVSSINLIDFSSPEIKTATYTQVSRLFGSVLRIGGLSMEPSSKPVEVNLSDETFITSDIDMLVFKNIFNDNKDKFQIYGADLVPPNQYPMCYAWATAAIWRRVMKIGDKNLQQCLDEQLGHEKSINMRGDLWSRDQELLYKYVNASDVPFVTYNRARPGTQFAMNRIDRDDSFFMDRLDANVFDYHCHRPGYTPENFDKIRKVIQYMYPESDLTWMRDYRDWFVKEFNL